MQLQAVRLGGLVHWPAWRQAQEKGHVAEQSSLCWRAPAWAQDLPPGPAGHSTVRFRLRVCVPLQSQADQKPQPLSMQSTTCREEGQRALLAGAEYWPRGGTSREIPSLTAH